MENIVQTMEGLKKGRYFPAGCAHVYMWGTFALFQTEGGSEIMEASYNSTLDFKQQSFNCLGDLWDFIHKCVFFLSRTFENVIYCHKMEIECKSFIIHM